MPGGMIIIKVRLCVAIAVSSMLHIVKNCIPKWFIMTIKVAHDSEHAKCEF